MKTLDYIKKSLPNAFGVFVYVFLIAWFLSNAEAVFGGRPETFLIPIFMLLLLIISASITGFLVLGKPITMYLNNQRKEAVILLFSTLAWLVLFLVLTGVSMLS